MTGESPGRQKFSGVDKPGMAVDRERLEALKDKASPMDIDDPHALEADWLDWWNPGSLTEDPAWQFHGRLCFGWDAPVWEHVSTLLVDQAPWRIKDAFDRLERAIDSDRMQALVDTDLEHLELLLDDPDALEVLWPICVDEEAREIERDAAYYDGYADSDRGSDDWSCDHNDDAEDFGPDFCDSMDCREGLEYLDDVERAEDEDRMEILADLDDVTEKQAALAELDAFNNNWAALVGLDAENAASETQEIWDIEERWCPIALGRWLYRDDE